MKLTGRVQMSIITPIREMLACVDKLEPENSNSWVITAPIVPPLPVIPDITPSDLQKESYCVLQAIYEYHAYIVSIFADNSATHILSKIGLIVNNT